MALLKDLPNYWVGDVDIWKDFGLFGDAVSSLNVGA
jgi:hypothetical protein